MNTGKRHTLQAHSSENLRQEKSQSSDTPLDLKTSSDTHVRQILVLIIFALNFYVHETLS